MATTCPFEDHAAAHALGALDAEERAAFERHLAEGCPTCGPELAAMERVVEAIAASAQPVRPRTEVRRRVVERATGVVPLRRPGPVPRTGSRVLALAASVALLLAAGAVLWGTRLERRLATAEGERAALIAELTQAQATLARAQATVERGRIERAALQRQLSVLGANRLEQVQLAALPPAPSANGRLFVDPSSGEAVFAASKLPTLPRDRTYQLWFIAGGKPVSAGTFDVGERGSARLLVQSVPPAGSIDAWAVTVEPAGGVPQPTGAMVLKS